MVKCLLSKQTEVPTSYKQIYLYLLFQKCSLKYVTFYSDILLTAQSAGNIRLQKFSLLEFLTVFLTNVNLVTGEGPVTCESDTTSVYLEASYPETQRSVRVRLRSLPLVRRPKISLRHLLIRLFDWYE